MTDATSRVGWLLIGLRQIGELADLSQRSSQEIAQQMDVGPQASLMPRPLIAFAIASTTCGASSLRLQHVFKQVNCPPPSGKHSGGQGVRQWRGSGEGVAREGEGLVGWWF